MSLFGTDLFVIANHFDIEIKLKINSAVGNRQYADGFRITEKK